MVPRLQTFEQQQQQKDMSEKFSVRRKTLRFFKSILQQGRLQKRPPV